MVISQLEVFLAVAREGGFSRAAEKLYRAQAAVSQAVRKLEAEIGEPLFDRRHDSHRSIGVTWASVDAVQPRIRRQVSTLI